MNQALFVTRRGIEGAEAPRHHCGLREWVAYFYHFYYNN